jgi:hypothetical protein
MSTVLPLPETMPRPQPKAPAASKPPSGWLIAPTFDLLFLANLTWPVIVLLALRDFAWINQPLGFLQVYFLSSPHRWITLMLVFGDRERFAREPLRFAGIGLALVALGFGLILIAQHWPGIENPLILLMMLDYAWNAWHFASQHAGISRIYGRMTRPNLSDQAAAFEKMAIRTLVLWVFFRLAVLLASTREMAAAETIRAWLPFLDWIDPVVLIAPLMLLGREIAAYRPHHLGRLAYIGSVVALYGVQLAAIHFRQRPMMNAVFLAGAVFHAVEYLAICNWSVRKKSTGLWHYQLSRTGLGVLIFMAVLGIGNWLIDRQSGYAWAMITLLVSLLHYGYDGMIWKSRPKGSPKATSAESK